MGIWQIHSRGTNAASVSSADFFHRALVFSSKTEAWSIVQAGLLHGEISRRARGLARCGVFSKSVGQLIQRRRAVAVPVPGLRRPGRLRADGLGEISGRLKPDEKREPADL